MFRQLFTTNTEDEIKKSEEIKSEREEVEKILEEPGDFEIERPNIEDENVEEQEDEEVGENETYSDDADDKEEGNNEEKIKVKIGDVEEEFTKEEVEKILENVFLNEDKENITDEAKMKLSIVDNLPIEQLKMVADALGGNTEAKKALLKQLNIDPYEIDLEEDVNYNPNLEELQTDNVQSFIENISKKEPKIASEVVETFNSLPEDAQREFYDVRALRVMAEYAKNGMLKKLTIKAKAKKQINPFMSWAEAFALAEQEVVNTDKKVNKETKSIKTKKKSSTKTEENPYLLDTDTLRKEVYSLLGDKFE